MKQRSPHPAPWLLLSLAYYLGCDQVSSDGLTNIQTEPTMPRPGGSPPRPLPRPTPPVPGTPIPPIDEPIGTYTPDAGVDAAEPSEVRPPDDGAAPAPDAAAAPDPAPPPPDAAPVAPRPPTIDCPEGNENLRLCFRFEQNLTNESANDVDVESEQIRFEPGAGGVGSAARMGPQSSLRVRQTGGVFNAETFTIEAWIRLDRLPGPGDRATVIDKEGRFGLYLLPGGAVSCSSGNTSATSPAGLVAAGQWVSLACTTNGQTLGVWVSGRRTVQSAGPMVRGDTMGGLAVGKTMDEDDPLTGLLDNVRFWTQMRAPAQICAAAIGCQPD